MEKSSGLMTRVGAELPNFEATHFYLILQSPFEIMDFQLC